MESENVRDEELDYDDPDNSGEEKSDIQIFVGALVLLAGLGLAAVAVWSFFDAKSEIDNNPLLETVIYLKALFRMMTAGMLALGIYIFSKTFD